jgi:hypothetical protein
MYLGKANTKMCVAANIPAPTPPTIAAPCRPHPGLTSAMRVADRPAPTKHQPAACANCSGSPKNGRTRHDGRCHLVPLRLPAAICRESINTGMAPKRKNTAKRTSKANGPELSVYARANPGPASAPPKTKRTLTAIQITPSSANHHLWEMQTPRATYAAALSLSFPAFFPPAPSAWTPISAVPCAKSPSA